MKSNFNFSPNLVKKTGKNISALCGSPTQTKLDHCWGIVQKTDVPCDTTAVLAPTDGDLVKQKLSGSCCFLSNCQGAASALYFVKTDANPKSYGNSVHYRSHGNTQWKCPPVQTAFFFNFFCCHGTRHHHRFIIIIIIIIIPYTKCTGNASYEKNSLPSQCKVAKTDLARVHARHEVALQWIPPD